MNYGFQLRPGTVVVHRDDGWTEFWWGAECVGCYLTAAVSGQ